jgi:hypothetical protein
MAIRFAVCSACGSRAVSVWRRGVRPGFVRCSCAACGRSALVPVAPGDSVAPGYRRRSVVRERPGESYTAPPGYDPNVLAKAARYADLAKEPWVNSLKCRCGKYAHILDAGRCLDRPQVWSIFLACRHCRIRFHIFRRSERKERRPTVIA